MTSDVKKDLEDRCDQLSQRGVKDVKFCFASLSERPLSHVAKDVVEVMDAVLAKKFKPMAPLGDSQNK